MRTTRVGYYHERYSDTSVRLDDARREISQGHILATPFETRGLCGYCIDQRQCDALADSMRFFESPREQEGCTQEIRMQRILRAGSIRARSNMG